MSRRRRRQKKKKAAALDPTRQGMTRERGGHSDTVAAGDGRVGDRSNLTTDARENAGRGVPRWRWRERDKIRQIRTAIKFC